ncbi:MAG: transporter substrate-binding domain-containing protein [Verrucomicrobia bacterium]|nr:transporter substrate-binding domain-containing protein [Verrucomicrobiota bacterium]
MKCLPSGVALWLIAAGFLPAATPLRIAVERSNPPLGFVDEQQQPAGFMVDLIREMSRVSGVPMEAVPGYWKEHFVNFPAGKLDAFGNLLDTPNNRADTNLSIGHARLHAVVYSRRDRPALRRIADFSGKRIATIRGTAADVAAHLNQGWGAKIQTFSSGIEALEGVRRGEFDAVLLTNQFYRLPVPERGLARNFVEDLVNCYHFGTRKDDLRTLGILNEALAQLMRNGEFDRIYAKWLGPIEPREIRLADLQPYYIPAALVVAGVAAFMLWQRRMVRRLAQQADALRVSEQRWRFALDGSGAAVWDWDLVNGRVFYSRAWKRLLGYDESEIGDTLEDSFRLLHPEDSARVDQTLMAHREKPGVPFALEQRLRCRDGSWKWVLNRGIAVGGEGSPQPTRLIGTYTDLTLQKQAEEDRLVLGKLESTGILAGGIAHDFNNLLTTMVLNLDMAQWPDITRAQAAEFLGDARKAAMAAHDLTQQLITFARGGAAIRRPSALQGLIRESTQLALSGSSTVALFDLDPQLWPAEVDPTQIGQVLRNLVLNAREAMPAAGTVTVTAANVTLPEQAVRGLPAGKYVRISVADQGPGIPPELVARIFDPYFSTKQRGSQKGMGLGLTICLSVAKQHHGAITVDSAPGRGSVFHVYLPACLSPQPEPTSPPTPAVGAPGTQTARALVMDDEPGLRTAVAATLRQLGFGVTEASDGAAAIAAYRAALIARAPFDVVLLDLTVRGAMGGQEALTELRKIDSEIVAIVMSGYADSEALRDYRSHGFKSALPKPFTVEALQRALREARG